MVKAVIEYTHHSKDTQIINHYLFQNHAKILKTKIWRNTYAKVTIAIESKEKLDELISVLNDKLIYGAVITKAHKTVKLFGVYI